MAWGIDFGTTNTAVSHMENGNPVVVELGGAQQDMRYVPSLVAKQTTGSPGMYFGRMAKQRIGQPGVTSYHNFNPFLTKQ
jgi:molecular chaperone DnaK